MTQTTLRRSANPWRVGVVAGMASYIDAAAISGFGTAMVIYQGALGLSPEEVGLSSGVLTLGIAVGALAGGRLGDRFGRRPVFTVTMIAIVLGAVALVLADSFPLIVLGAILLGLATGADLPVSLSTISEAADDTNRGRMLSLSNLLWIAGAVASGVIGILAGGLGRPGGQLMFAHIAIVALIVMVARLSIPESDVWKRARAERRIQNLEGTSGPSMARALLRGPYLVPFVGLLVFYGFTNLAANTGGQFGSYLLVNYAGVDVSTAILAAIPTLPLVIIGTLWFMKIADSPRRFTYFKVGAVLWVVAMLIPVVFGFSLTTYIASAVLGVAGGVFSFEPIMKVWTQEQFPTLLRTTAQGAIIAVARLLASLLAVVTPTIAAISPSLLYGLLAFLATIGLATAWVVFRTRDRHSEFADSPSPIP